MRGLIHFSVSRIFFYVVDTKWALFLIMNIFKDKVGVRLRIIDLYVITTWIFDAGQFLVNSKYINRIMLWACWNSQSIFICKMKILHLALGLINLQTWLNLNILNRNNFQIVDRALIIYWHTNNEVTRSICIALLATCFFAWLTLAIWFLEFSFDISYATVLTWLLI